jgi:NAD(P)-dependent dehydrogenase (short-subunit alcohol dehydrogenase family)
MPKLLLAAQTNPKGATRIINVSSGSPHTAAIRWSDPNFERKNADLPPDEQPNYAFHAMWNIPDAQNLSYTPLEAYNQSKVANVLFGIALTRRLYEQHGILSVAVHPGVIQTELVRSANPEIVRGIATMFETGEYTYKTLGAGSATSLVAALDPRLGPPGEVKEGRENWGAFLVDCQIVQPGHPRAARSDEAERLWVLSERLVGEEFTW